MVFPGKQIILKNIGLKIPQDAFYRREKLDVPDLSLQVFKESVQLVLVKSMGSKKKQC